MEVSIGGGEPFIREDIKYLIEGIVKNRMRFSVLSNGTLATEELASYIASTGRCNGIQISIDGATPDIHDLSRGHGNFDRAVRGTRVFLGAGIPVTVRVTINSHNVGNLEEIAALLFEDLGLPSFSTNSASLMGMCRDNNSLQLSMGERQLAMETLLRLNKKYNGRISAQAGPLAEVRDWKRMEESRSNGLTVGKKGGYMRACGGVFSKMAVRADGVMVPCTQMSHIEMGRINRDGLKEVWHGHPELKRMRGRWDKGLNEFEFCRGCDYIPYCTGNCPAMAHALTGDDNQPSPDACYRKFLDAGGKLPVEAF